MICVFPDPYPDELLYSVCARYKDQMQYPNSKTATNDFFGSGSVSAVVDLPNRLEYLVSSLPPGHLYTVDEFIDKNTMFPFYAPFLSSERARFVRDEMRKTGDNQVFERIGLQVYHFVRPLWLRFCPACVDVDKRRFRETYWHRVHQIPGVEVCPQHAALLEMSSAPFNNFRNPGEAISAESVMKVKAIRSLDLSDRSHNILLNIARNAAWTLKHTEGLLGKDDLREHYYNHLLARGLAYYNGKVRASKLADQFIEHYSPQILKSLGCEIKNRYSNWLLRLVHSGLTGVSHPPIRHILLIIFLGCTTEEFFTPLEEFKPFGNKPWPCLNRASDHFGQLLIDECRVSDSWVKKRRGNPVGTFSCKCGFVYNRIGPDNSEKDRYRINSIESYGPVWEKALREIWGDTSISLREAARRLGVSELTVVRYAIRLELPMNTSSTRSVGPKTLERYKSFRRSKEEALEFYRQEWLSLLKANPDASRRQLATISSFLYMWLKKTDSEWLEAHLPLVRKTNRQGELKDWNKIDIELAPAVEATAKRIREAPGRPTRISLAAIMREVGHKSWLEFSLHKLPLTSKVLENYLESVEDFLIRRVRWAEDWYSQSGTCPTRHYFEVRAGTRHKAGKAPAVQSATDAAMERLSK